MTDHLHGITLDRHAADLTGRPGVGIALPLPVEGHPDGVHLEFVLNPKTYQFLGLAMTDHIDPTHPTKSGYAVIRSGLVTPKH